MTCLTEQNLPILLGTKKRITKEWKRVERESFVHSRQLIMGIREKFVVEEKDFTGKIELPTEDSRWI